MILSKHKESINIINYPPVVLGPLCTVIRGWRLLLRNWLLPRRRLLLNNLSLFHHPQAAVVLRPLSTVIRLTSSSWWSSSTPLRTSIVSAPTPMATITSIVAATSATISTMAAATATSIPATNLLMNQLLCTLNCLSTALDHNALLASALRCRLVNLGRCQELSLRHVCWVSKVGNFKMLACHLAVSTRLTANVANGFATLAHH